MRKLSVWARRHPKLARLYIILLYIPINITGLITGDLLFDVGVQLPGSFLLSAMALFIITAYCYPDRSSIHNASHEVIYLRRKICDQLLIIATFLMICFTGNQTNVSTPFYPLATTIAGSASPFHNTFLTESIVPSSDGAVSKKINRKEIRKQRVHLIREFRRLYKNRPKGEKIALIALTLIVASSLETLIAGLACTIACSGSEALSYIVFFGGTIAIGLLTYIILHRLINGRPVNKPGSAPPVSSR